jgi:hypothetical protein
MWSPFPSGGSTAFDADVIDTLPANISLVPGSATARINGVPVAGFVVNPTTLPGGALAWGRQNGDETFDIPAGQSLVLTYRVTVVSVNGLPINNSVYGDWTSLQDAQSGERTGASCPTLPNNYCYGPVSTSIATVDTTTIAKSVVSDSWNTGLSTGTDSILRVGDTVVYRLALTLREGQLQNVVVPTLPAALPLTALSHVATPPAFSLRCLPIPRSRTCAGQYRHLELGDIINAVDNNTANDTLSSNTAHAW